MSRLATSSRPTWACGLKLQGSHYDELKKNIVTPHVGVWIETATLTSLLQASPSVTPHVGVWIETITVMMACTPIRCHAPRGRVD